ncbi:hypothetical protein [Fodinicola feengrottensis]|uniref:hypothetical protein n=1 Tax=Fodinicola feengrottensis TaxID=435914 RepID=UPI0013D4BF97|nr:hypothetical protein [Fodinicola feengrottensis]
MVTFVADIVAEVTRVRPVATTSCPGGAEASSGVVRDEGGVPAGREPPGTAGGTGGRTGKVTPGGWTGGPAGGRTTGGRTGEVAPPGGGRSSGGRAQLLAVLARRRQDAGQQ